jgi:hypothetical protein
MKAKASAMHLSQTEYIREAIKRMNAETAKSERTKQLIKASQLVRKESMIINKEFSEIEQDPEVE